MKNKRPEINTVRHYKMHCCYLSNSFTLLWFHFKVKVTELLQTHLQSLYLLLLSNPNTGSLYTFKKKRYAHFIEDLFYYQSKEATVCQHHQQRYVFMLHSVQSITGGYFKHSLRLEKEERPQIGQLSSNSTCQSSQKGLFLVCQ